MEPFQNTGIVQMVMFGDFAQNGSQRSRFEWTVGRHGEMVFAILAGGQPPMRAYLPGEGVAEGATKGLFQMGSGDVARQFHARAKTSSMTR